MMKSIKKKLNSELGASISFALFAFIVATIVSLIIVTAALSNVIKTKQERENEQAYLVAESIANMISEEVIPTNNGSVSGADGKNYTSRYIRIVETDDGTGNISITATASTDAAGDPSKVIAEPFKTVLEDICLERYKKVKNETIVSNSFSKSAEKTIDISVGNITAASGAQLSSDVANLINSSDTKITAYLPETEAKYNINTGDLIKNLSDYYDLDFLIEVPINASQTYKVRLHFDAELKQVDGKDISYVYWPTSRMIKGE